jgi:hypothetical protein
VGFAAEHGARAIERAREKLAAKGLDAIVVNDISRTDIGFDVDANEVTILTAGDPLPAPAGDGQPDGSAVSRAPSDGVRVPRASKAAVAEAILDVVERLRTAR